MPDHNHLIIGHHFHLPFLFHFLIHISIHMLRASLRENVCLSQTADQCFALSPATRHGREKALHKEQAVVGDYPPIQIGGLETDDFVHVQVILL